MHLALDILEHQNFALQNYDRVVPGGAGAAELAAVDALDRHRQFVELIFLPSIWMPSNSLLTGYNIADFPRIFRF